MRIEIEIPEEFEKDYTTDKFADFLGRVRADIDYNGICGNYERETADVLAEAFKNSRVIQEVAYKGGRLVDADKLYDDLADKLKWLMGYGDDVYLSAGDDIRCAVANQPTAYDPDMVTEQLKYNTTLFFDRNGDKVLLDDAIKIVKAGGDVDLLIDRAKSKSGERIPYDGKWK